MCYSELGTLIQESGGELIYILRGFQTINKRIGEFLAFLYSWSAVIILKPTSIATNCLACANYILRPIMGSCGPPNIILKMGAIIILSKNGSAVQNEKKFFY